MKLRPQFNLRFRDVEQFELVMSEAERDHISMNEWILIHLEQASVVVKGQRIAAEREIVRLKAANLLMSLDTATGEVKVIPEGENEHGAKKETSIVRADEAGDTQGWVESGDKGGGAAGGGLLGGGHGAQGAGRRNRKGNSGVIETGTGKSERVGEAVGLPDNFGSMVGAEKNPGFKKLDEFFANPTGMMVDGVARPAHAANCQCFICKPPKDAK